ncbi:MAG: hypothetical protein Q9216_005934 [Gyalolechia sp. 2 TL-2023]
MTEVTTQPEADGQSTAVRVPELSHHNAHDTNHLHFNIADSAKDNDTSERPVREALKKTSIASMPRNDPATKAPKAIVDHDSTTEPTERQGRDSTGKQTPSPTSEPRGRLSRKRSYDDTIEAGISGNAPAEIYHGMEDVNHSRKRSRDVRAVQLPTTEPLAAPTEQPLLEAESANDISLEDEVRNEEMEGSAQSPRKKRSRDEFDIDAHRGQKIPATDEARAYRRSEDSERGQLPQQGDKGVSPADISIHQEQDTSPEDPASLDRSEPPKSRMVPPLPNTSASSTHKASKTTEAESKAAQKPLGGFEASRFATMSGLSESPFGKPGGSSQSVFRSNSTTTSNNFGTAKENTAGLQKPQAETSAFSNSASPFLTSTTKTSGVAGFGSNANGAASKLSGFGASVFGSAFANPAASAPRLANFASPTGDMAPSKPPESTKAFGTRTDDSAEEDGGSEGEVALEEVGNGDIEIDSRFQQQEGKRLTLRGKHRQR